MSLSVVRLLPVTTDTDTVTLGASSTYDGVQETLTVRYFISVDPDSVTFSGVAIAGTGPYTLTRVGGFPKVKVGDDVTGANFTPNTGTIKVTALNPNGSITVSLTGDAVATTGTGASVTFNASSMDQTVYKQVTQFSLGLENGRAAVLNQQTTWYSYDGTKYDTTGNVANASSVRSNAPVPVNLDTFLNNLRVPPV